MSSLWTTLLLTAFWGAYVLSPAGLRTTLAPNRAPASPETETIPRRQEIEITEANSQQHPKIKAMRQIVSPVDAGLKKGKYQLEQREFATCPNQYFTLRRIARDSRGVVAWYEHYFEYEDGSYDFHHYYDHAGRLRFVFASTRAANGTREQHRIYFDETGKRIWEVTRDLKGPGCPGCFPIPYPDEALAHDAARAFANDKGCKEIKPQPKPRTRKTQTRILKMELQRNGTQT